MLRLGWETMPINTEWEDRESLNAEKERKKRVERIFTVVDGSAVSRGAAYQVKARPSSLGRNKRGDLRVAN